MIYDTEAEVLKLLKQIKNKEITITGGSHPLNKGQRRVFDEMAIIR